MQWISQNRHGFDNVNVVIKETGHNFTVDEVKAYSNDKAQVNQSLMSGFKLIDSKFSLIENQPYVSLYSQGELTRAGKTVELYFIQSQIFYKDKLVALSCSTPPERQKPIKTLCNQILNSIVFSPKSKKFL